MNPFSTTLCNQLLKPGNRFQFNTFISSLPVTTVSFFAPLARWSTVCKGKVFRQFCDKIQSSIHQIFTRCFQQFLQNRHTWRVPQHFHKPSIKQRFPTFHYRTSSFCCFPIFFVRILQAPFNNTQDFDTPWQASLHIIFPLQTKFTFWREPCFSPMLEHTPITKGTCSLIRPWCPSFKGLRASMDLFVKNFIFQWSPLFSTFESPNKIPPKRHMQFQQPPPSIHFSRQVQETWTQLLAYK